MRIILPSKLRIWSLDLPITCPCPTDQAPLAGAFIGNYRHFLPDIL